MKVKQTVCVTLAAFAVLSSFGVNAVSGQDAGKAPVPILAAAAADATDKTPRQLNVHFGDDASTSVNVTYTTLAACKTLIVLNEQGTQNYMPFTGSSDAGQANKVFHKISVTGLKPGTTYEYTVGEGADTYKGKFKTAPAAGSTDSFKFAYLADTQVSNGDNAKALGATLHEVNQLEGLDFVYLAGDVTDSATNEAQWEYLFNNQGAYPNGGQDMFANNAIAVVQGNHDNNTMNRHINAPAEAGNIVYSFDYGPAKFIMLNLEAARSDADARAQQEAYMRAAVAEAKQNGQWTIVGFHKSLYTGASHITDSDIVAARAFWAPKFAELDVDMVLQGHDHVYSRGFVEADGQKADKVVNAQGEVQQPDNAPLYLVGGHAGGLKWYSKKNYTVAPGDPLTANYSFLDVNSTDGKDGKAGSDVLREQVIVELEVSETAFTLNTYMFKYDTATDTIVTPKYLYDTLTVTRDVSYASIDGSDRVILEKGDTVTYDVTMENVKDTNAYEAEVSYDADKLELVSAESKVENTLFTDVKNENGKARVTIGTSLPATVPEAFTVATFTFKVKETAEAGDTAVTLSKVASAQVVSENGQVTGAFDVTPNLADDQVVTNIYSYRAAADVNGDGKITLADLSIALANYQSATAPKCDIDLDGVVDTKDFILISSYMAA